MTKCSGKQFDPLLLDLFFNHVALFPVGTVLRTALGFAIVKSTTIGMTRYPKVILFTDSNRRLLDTPVTLEVSQQESDFIESILDGSELTSLCYHLKYNPSVLLLENQ